VFVKNKFAIYITFKLFIDWYSSGVYYTTEAITNIIPTTISACFVTVWHFIYKINWMSKRFLTYFLFKSFEFTYNGRIRTFSGNNTVPEQSNMFMLGSYINFRVYFKSNICEIWRYARFIKYLANTSFINYVLNSVFISFYGFNRCLNISSQDFEKFWTNNDNQFIGNTNYILILFFTFRVMALIVLWWQRSKIHINLLLNIWNTNSEKLKNN